MHRKTKRICAAAALAFMVVGTVWMTIEMMNDLGKPVSKGHQVKARTF